MKPTAILCRVVFEHVVSYRELKAAGGVYENIYPTPTPITCGANRTNSIQNGKPGDHNICLSLIDPDDRIFSATIDDRGSNSVRIHRVCTCQYNVFAAQLKVLRIPSRGDNDGVSILCSINRLLNRPKLIWHSQIKGNRRRWDRIA